MTVGVVARTARGCCRDGGAQRGPLDTRACRLSPPMLLSLPAQTSSLSACPPPPPRLSPAHCLPGCVHVCVPVCAQRTTHSQGGQRRRQQCACCHMRPWRARTCAHADGEERPDSTQRPSCALCCEALASVPSLPCRRNRAATSCRDAEACARSGRSSACVCARTCAPRVACATTGDADALLLPAPRPDRSAVGTAPLLSQRMMGAGVVRLSRPRHGQPFLCFVVRDPIVCAVARTRTPTLPCPAHASFSLLHAALAHAPPSGCAQRWPVKGRGVPSTVGAGELLAATPLDLTFSAHDELLGDAQRCDRVARTFVPAADLYRAGGVVFSARTSATAAGCEAAAPVANALVSALGGVRGGGEDWRSPRSACAPLTAELSAWGGADETRPWGAGARTAGLLTRGRGRRRRPCALPRLTGGLPGRA
ncbi:hypothetical protein LMJF_12_1015 [Leishmania major strain Friedlin]|uniref:Uncharacterized protein n=1 Tax=Leishmania major TaxID=5664 RepID=Q4QGK9_LEIMA|nr:hypothetical protein LMJF_12_1015 [Leishmania major strain Friedlin]CAJ02811.1 hypothetical protein LMJF_12_1015 [Leishmania major strain Friedlin]|eukprot:XP_001681689.1 hypothetical protein LMJF_12_1015 [Leishmania major strain Friedlin]